MPESGGTIALSGMMATSLGQAEWMAEVWIVVRRGPVAGRPLSGDRRSDDPPAFSMRREWCQKRTR